VEFENEIIDQAVECVYLSLDGVDDYQSVGNSRFGGTPDLPPEILWPRTDSGKYFSFIWQINLSKMPGTLGNPLPTSGVLYFFVAEDETCTTVVTRLLYYPGPADSLRKAPAPSDEEFAHEYYRGLTPFQLVGNLAIDIPSYGSDLCAHIEQNAQPDSDGYATTRYLNFVSALIAVKPSVGKLLGYGSFLHGNILENAVLTAAGQGEHLYDLRYRQDRAVQLEQDARAWRLLWCIDSSTEVGFCIWDAGSYYTMIKESDLKNLEFSATYTEIETG